MFQSFSLNGIGRVFFPRQHMNTRRANELAIEIGRGVILEWLSNLAVAQRIEFEIRIFRKKYGEK